MNRISIVIIAMLLALGTIVGCSILKENDTEGKVKNYLVRFAADLQQSDSLAAKHFRTDQPEWALRNALQLLRNDVESPVKTQISFQNAILSTAENISISIPLTFSADSAGKNSQRTINLELKLAQEDTSFVISQWNGEDLYEKFWAFSTAILDGKNLQVIQESRGFFYDRAKELQQQYDSVIWYATIGGQHYYYVVSGQWNYPYKDSLATDQYRMGLVDESGKIIVPLEFDLIGMPGTLHEDIIEVKKDNKFGYYRLSTGEELIPTDYTWTVPYKTDNSVMLGKKDSVFGWIASDFTFAEGYPDEKAEAYITNYKFLPVEINLKHEEQEFLEIPLERYAAVGFWVTPGYLSHFRIFKQIEGNFQRELSNEEGDIEFLKTKISFLEKVTNNLGALITRVREGYVYGREGFYDQNVITFISTTGQAVDQIEIGWNGKVSCKMIDSTLLEIKISSVFEELEEYEKESEYLGRRLTPHYKYFEIGKDQKFIEKEQYRGFPTEFVKLDSTYITYIDQDKQLAFIPDDALNLMRNEILASYGYIFIDPNITKKFKYSKWYNPQHNTVADFQAELTEIDLHNLKFLERILGPVDNSTPLI